MKGIAFAAGTAVVTSLLCVTLSVVAHVVISGWHFYPGYWINKLWLGLVMFAVMIPLAYLYYVTETRKLAKQAANPPSAPPPQVPPGG